MLSNKLTFSLTSLVLMCAFALAFLATPAIAQRTGPADEGPVIAKDKFGIVGRSATATDLGFVGDATAIEGGDMPDLAELLLNGGTIELQMQLASGTPGTGETANGLRKAAAAAAAKGASPGATADEKKNSMWQKAVISEVMWGRDDPSGDIDAKQWIEVFSQVATIAPVAFDAASTSPALRLVYYRGASPSMPDKVIEDDFAVAPNANTDTDAGWVLVDRVSTVNRFGSRWTSVPGQSGNTEADTSPATPVSQLKSMYRKIDLEAGNYKLEGGNLKGLGDGREMGSWAQSEGRINMSGPYVGSPNSVHVTAGGAVVSFAKNPASFAHKGVIINEVRNDTSEANLDWIELFYSTDDSTATSVNVENWELSIVTDDYKDTSLAVLPKHKMRAGDYLVVYNRDPGRSVALAGGVNVQDVIDRTHVEKGGKHMYVIAEELDLPADKQFLILLRNGNDKKGTHEKLVDYAGNGFYARMVPNKFETDVWPFVGWTKPDVAKFGDTATFGSRDMSWGRPAVLNSLGQYWAKTDTGKSRVHGDLWTQFGFMGAGYDRGRDKVVDTRTSPGTPGYPNVSINVTEDDRDTTAGTDDYFFSGVISISEIMYDAGPRWNLVQWIELYNSSTTETINLEGWEFEIRNEATDIESYVDASFEFVAGTVIPPNQTLLLVSTTGSNDVPSNYVYDLRSNHRKQLGLDDRTKRLLSAVGFHLELSAKINEGGREEMKMMDEAGNVKVDGAARLHMWDLPKRGEGEIRRSIVRKYGPEEVKDGSYPKDDGTMASSWKQVPLTGAGLTYYGHRDDVGTPGYRLGGPLPVTLSKFRPVRNQTTGHVDITWITQSELNNAGFNILRSETKAGEFQVINVKGIIAGHGTTSEKHVYTFTDTTAKPNVVYYYQIEDVSINGQRTTLTTTHLRGNVSAGGKLTTRWGELKSSVK